jgi:transposase-like protein
MTKRPKTLEQAIVYFSDPDNCLAFLVSRRWPKGVVTCPRCGSDNVTYMKPRQLWQCNSRHPKAQFSVKAGTVFEASALGLDIWLTAIWMIANEKNRISSRELAGRFGITQKSTWYLLHRISTAMDESEYVPAEPFDFDSYLIEVLEYGGLRLSARDRKILTWKPHRTKPVYKFKVPSLPRE